MGLHVGRPYSPRQLLASEERTPDDVRGVRAYPVPRLVGAVVKARSEADLVTALEALLHRGLPQFAWHVDESIIKPLRRYGVLHTSIPGPLDGNDEPMWLELAGDVVALGGSRIGRHTSWIDLRPMSSDDLLATEMPGPIAVKITVATYANTQYPGVGVPLYM